MYQKEEPVQLLLKYGTSTGKTILSNNNSKIPEKILKRLMRMIEANSSDIIDEWLNHFEEIRYFC